MKTRAAFLFFVLFLVSQIQAETKKIELHFFGSGTCGECLQIKEVLLKPLQEKYPDDLSIRYYDTDKDSVLSVMIKMEEKYKTNSNAAQMLFLPDTFLAGFEDIMRSGYKMITARIKDKDKYIAQSSVQSDTAALNSFLKDKALDFGFFAGTLVAGLADGINPCAIATMIFLISYLATRKKGKKEIFVIGLAYTSTVYITYFAMGLGLKGVLEHLKHYYIISQTIRWGAFGLAIIVAVLSFRDAIVFKKTRSTENISLQLPKMVKLRIHKIISGNLSGSSLVIGSIITGFLVTILEAICTGQMYLPYIVAMTQRETLRITGYLYLGFYNFLFVLPLIIVMFLAYFGLKWNDLAKRTQKNMVMLKIVLGLVMTGLAVYLGLGSFI
jgi:cytochrome c biogenesis protein CcdA